MNIIRNHIKNKVRTYLMEHLHEERAYPLSMLSAACSMAIDKLEVPYSSITDVKIVKGTRPIFKVFLENGQTFNLIDNDSFVQADIDRILYDVEDERDLNGAKSEIERLLVKGKMKDDSAEEEEFEEPESPEIPEEPADEEPIEEPEV